MGRFNSITTGSDGLGLISYQYSDDSDLRVAHCQSAVCNTVSIYTLDGPERVGEYTSIAIGSDGLGLISYGDATNGELKVVHCDEVVCAP